MNNTRHSTDQLNNIKQKPKNLVQYSIQQNGSRTDKMRPPEMSPKRSACPKTERKNSTAVKREKEKRKAKNKKYPNLLSQTEIKLASNFCFVLYNMFYIILKKEKKKKRTNFIFYIILAEPSVT